MRRRGGMSFERRQSLYERIEHRLDAAGPEALAEVQALRRYEPTPSTPSPHALAAVATAAIAARAALIGAPVAFVDFADAPLCCSWIIRCEDRTTTIDSRQSPHAFAAALRAFANREPAPRAIPIAVEPSAPFIVPVTTGALTAEAAVA